MAEYMTNTADLTTVADAIRAKSKTTEPLVFPEGFKTAVEGIKGGAPNGTEWEPCDMGGAAVSVQDIQKSGGLYVAGTNNGIYVSSNGKNWRPTNKTDGTFTVVCALPWIWLAAGTHGIWYSEDGETWAQSNVSASADYGNFVEGSTVCVISDSKGFLWSSDGKQWTKANISETTNKAVIFQNGLFIGAVASDIVRSTDGKTWSYCGIPANPFGNNNMDVAIIRYIYGNRFNAFDILDRISYVSSDGISWKLNGKIKNPILKGGLSVQGTASAPQYSQDRGTTWKTISPKMTALYLAEGNGVFAGADFNSKTVNISEDGITWRALVLPEPVGVQTVGIGLYYRSGAWIMNVKGVGVFRSTDLDNWDTAIGVGNNATVFDIPDGPWLADDNGVLKYSDVWEPS